MKDDGPVSYYSYSRDTKKGTFLFDSRPDLKSYTLAGMEPMSYQTRDGLTVHGYITYPVGKERTNLPLVLNVHGGPWYRDTWGYNPEAQWLANRGYACLQVNFRGSTGYGKDFVNAGDREWGGKMQEDLVDAVGWAVDQGIADPKRVAIMGGSYGGYATLVGVTFTPDLFTCAVAACAPSNLITFIETVPPYWSSMLTVLHKRVGNPTVADKEFLESRSPLFKVDAIKIPLMIAHGANDPRVKQAEAEQIVEAMKTKGIPHEYLLFPDEGHGFAKPEQPPPVLRRGREVPGHEPRREVRGAAGRAVARSRRMWRCRCSRPGRESPTRSFACSTAKVSLVCRPTWTGRPTRNSRLEIEEHLRSCVKAQTMLRTFERTIVLHQVVEVEELAFRPTCAPASTRRCGSASRRARSRAAANRAAAFRIQVRDGRRPTRQRDGWRM